MALSGFLIPFIRNRNYAKVTILLGIFISFLAIFLFFRFYFNFVVHETKPKIGLPINTFTVRKVYAL